MAKYNETIQKALHDLHFAEGAWKASSNSIVALDALNRAEDSLIEAVKSSSGKCATCRWLDDHRAWAYCTKHNNLSFGDDQDQLLQIVSCPEYESRLEDAN